MFEKLKQVLSSYTDSQLHTIDITPLATEYIHITNVGQTKQHSCLFALF